MVHCSASGRFFHSAMRARTAGVKYASSMRSSNALLGTFQTFLRSRRMMSTDAVMPGRSRHSPVAGSFWLATSMTVS